MNTSEIVQKNQPLTPADFESMMKSGKPLKSLFNLKNDDIDLLTHMAYELYSQGRISDAQTMFEGLISLGESNAFIHTAMGNILAQSDDLDRAIEHLDYAIELDHSSINALTSRAEVRLKRNEFESAADDLRKAIELDPEEKDPVASRARVLVMVTHELMKAVGEQKI